MTENLTRAPILILGIGNILLRDEGIGVHVIEAMRKIDLPDSVELLDGGTAGADLLDTISDRQKLIVIDALDADVPAGTIVHLKPQDLQNDSPKSISLHEFGIAETLMMAAQLKCSPAEVSIIAVKPKDISCGLELSSQMMQLMPRLIEIILKGLFTV